MERKPSIPPGFRLCKVTDIRNVDYNSKDYEKEVPTNTIVNKIDERRKIKNMI